MAPRPLLRQVAAGVFIIAIFSLMQSPAVLAQLDVNVDLNVEHQTMDGTASNTYGFILTSGWSPNVLNLILNDINLSHMRIRSNIHFWEPSNDNSDPNSINWGAFDDSGYVHNDLLLMQKLSDNGIECILGIWDVPEWMVLNPGASHNRIIPPSMYPEFAELILSFLLYAKNSYDTDINIIGIQNEPNIGYKNYFSPQELADATDVVMKHLAANGLGHVKVHVGDVNEPNSAVDYFEPSLNNSYIANRTCALSYHTWHNMTATILGEVRDFAASRGFRTWATEVGTSPLNSGSWDWAMGSMKNHHYAYKLGNASMAFQWCIAGAETSIDKSGNPHPIYYGLKQYYEHIFPGSVRVDSTGDTGSMFTTAFVHKPTKKLTIVTINSESVTREVTYHLTAPDMGYWPFEAFKTGPSNNYEKVATFNVDPGQKFSFQLEGKSFHTFTCGYNHLPRVKMESEPTPGAPQLRDHTFTLTDLDGINADMRQAGIYFYSGTGYVTGVWYGMSNPPYCFQTTLKPGGTQLEMKLSGLPQNIGLLMIGGGVDSEGGLGLVWTMP